jgi:hypothetical protein
VIIASIVVAYLSACATNFDDQFGSAIVLSDPDRRQAALTQITPVNESQELALGYAQARNALLYDTPSFVNKAVDLTKKVTVLPLNKTTDGQQAIAYLADRKLAVIRSVKNIVDPVCSSISIRDIKLASSPLEKAEQLMSEACYFTISGQLSAADDSYLRAQAFYREAALEQVLPSYVLEENAFVSPPIFVMASRLCVDIPDFCL